MKIFSLEEIYVIAKSKSDFYKKLYSHLPDELIKFENLPLIDQNEFWKMNSLKDNHVLTAGLEDAIVFKSGGTTGSPKFSVYSREEWRSFTEAFGKGMGQFAIQKKDRIANLFYAGDLYASFLFIHDSLERSSQSSVNFPISGNVEAGHLANIINDFSINVLAGVPTTIINFAQYYLEKGIQLPSVDKILYGGESLYPDQRLFLKKVFPQAKAFSIGIASVDGGLLGFADESCQADEHRCFSDTTIVEIIDDYGNPIHEINKSGQIYLTSLTRTLMPIIRYPAGDRAMWVEAQYTINRKYCILGRSEEGARIGPISIYFDDIYRMLEPFRKKHDIRGFQLVTTRENLKDILTLRLSGSQNKSDLEGLNNKIIETLLAERPMIKDLLVDEKIGLPRVEWQDQLEVNTRTGKLRRVLDLRKSSV